MKKFIHVNDKKLEVWVKGEGKPVIILPGMVSSIIEWERLAEELSKEARIILFNRAGCGASEKGTKLRNVKENSNDLKVLIDKLEIRDPIIVGHSYGGLYLQYFAMNYPHIASGFVLADSTSVDSHLLDEVEIEGEDESSTASWVQKCKWYSTLTSEQLETEMGDWINNLQAGLPEKRHQEIVKFMSNPLMFAALGEELESDQKFARELKQFGKFPAVPAIIIGRDPKVSVNDMITDEGLQIHEAEQIEDVWQTLIKDQMKLADQAEYRLAIGAGHNIHKDNPDVIKNAILSLLVCTL